MMEFQFVQKIHMEELVQNAKDFLFNKMIKMI